MKTNLFLSHEHDARNGCKILGAQKKNNHFIYYNSKSENKKKNEEHKDEKQSVIDCIKMVVYCD